MSEFSRALSVTASGLKAQAARLRHVSENISNADTPGYRRKTVPFESVRELQTDVEHVRTGRVTLDRSDLEEIYDPSHPLANESGHYEGSNVDLMIEIARRPRGPAQLRGKPENVRADPLDVLLSHGTSETIIPPSQLEIQNGYSQSFRRHWLCRGTSGHQG